MKKSLIMAMLATVVLLSCWSCSDDDEQFNGRSRQPDYDYIDHSIVTINSTTRNSRPHIYIVGEDVTIYTWYMTVTMEYIYKSQNEVSECVSSSYNGCQISWSQDSNSSGNHVLSLEIDGNLYVEKLHVGEEKNIDISTLSLDSVYFVHCWISELASETEIHSDNCYLYKGSLYNNNPLNDTIESSVL